MARKIIDVVRQRQEELRADSVLATQNMMMAIAALRDGIRSDAWQLYMLQYVDQNPPGNPVNPDQLLRLTARDGTNGDLILDRQRAYLVANSICGPSTVETLHVGVNTIDYTMDPESLARPDAEDFTCPTEAGTATATQRTKSSGKSRAKKGQSRWNG